MIRLDELKIQNFRCVSSGHITFNKDVTVLVADNGIGKTTVLDAASLVLAQMVDEFTATKQSLGIVQTDVRLASVDGSSQAPQTPTIVTAIGDLNGRQIEWAARRKTYDLTPRRSTKDFSGVMEAAQEMKAALSNRPGSQQTSPLPIVAYYRSNRFALNTFFGNADRRRVKPLDDRLSGYRIYLEPLSDSQHFNKWYRKLVRDVKHSPVTGASNKDSSLQQLTAVNEAVERVLAPTGWHHIDWDETQQSVTAKHNVFGTLPLVVLSSGIRTTIAVAADIAHRCARLNPGLGQDIARRTPGVVLIDEVDLHLHPAWQQLIVELLHTAFPSIQFILSTHSPQVLSTVDSSAIRVIKLRNGIAEMNAPCFQTRGVISADVLAVIMGVDPVPKVPEGQWLSDYRVMIEEGRHDASEGVELRAKLVSHFGSQHPLMLECDRLIRFCDFKRRRAAEGGANASS